ncbi:MAG: hypothetical protein Q4D80_02755 [Pseudomonadota bacterium]|nr:hypothetical protein [Pseudomonadota bacterium]
MSFTPNLLSLKNFLGSSPKKAPAGLFKVTVVAFEDNCSLNCGLRFAELLKRSNLFDVTFFNEPFSKNFLNLQSRNFFDFIDRSNKILASTQADIVIWGYEEDGKIRLNFQVDNQYVIPNNLSFSLFDSLFIPLNYLTDINNFSESLLLLIYGVIVAAVTPVTNEQKQRRPQILNDIISLLSADKSPKDISKEFMPYIMNMLGKIYLSNTRDDLSVQDIKIIQNLFESALNSKQYMRLPIYYGCIYNNLGQLFETAFHQNKHNSAFYLKSAIANYQTAQKNLNRNYPYDYGLIAYHLALLYFEYWKYKADLQALRDAVAQLREAEKVYSFVQFPLSWCHIEELLGNYLTALGMQTQSNELMQLAIEAYKNRQKIFTQKTNPTVWANVQEKIGNIFYLLGKQNNDDQLMEEARNYFNSALEIYTELEMKADIKNVNRALLKIRNYLG